MKQNSFLFVELLMIVGNAIIGSIQDFILILDLILKPIKKGINVEIV